MRYLCLSLFLMCLSSTALAQSDKALSPAIPEGFEKPDILLLLKITQLEAVVATLQSELASTQSQLASTQEALALNTAADEASHHGRYMDSEAVAAVGPHFSGDHADLSNVTANQHHVPTSVDLSDLENAISYYDGLFDGVSRLEDPGTTQDTFRFSGMNVQVVNGTGGTGNVNGTGNLIIGYNELRGSGDIRSGSHMLVVGANNNYSSVGGMVVGRENTSSGLYSSVSGGRDNTASGQGSSVSGGKSNNASGNWASVSGGELNMASQSSSSISGGTENIASGIYSSVSGGWINVASGTYSSVSGGSDNNASGDWSAVSGGGTNTASGMLSSVSGGSLRNAEGLFCIEGDSGTNC